MTATLVKFAQAVLWASVISICLLTFVWPWVISPDPEQASFKLVAIATLLAFFAAMLVLLAQRVRAER